MPYVVLENCNFGVSPFKRSIFWVSFGRTALPGGVQRKGRFAYTLWKGVLEILGCSVWSPETTVKIGVSGRHHNFVNSAFLVSVLCVFQNHYFLEKQDEWEENQEEDGENIESKKQRTSTTKQGEKKRALNDEVDLPSRPKLLQKNYLQK